MSVIITPSPAELEILVDEACLSQRQYVSQEADMAKRAKAFQEHFPTEFSSPESKLIQRGTYDTGTRTMVLWFSAGTCYTYDGVDKQLWLGLAQASSKGNYFSRMIRPMYAGKLVEG